MGFGLEYKKSKTRMHSGIAMIKTKSGSILQAYHEIISILERTDEYSELKKN
jgi:hypothetical protein